MRAIMLSLISAMFIFAPQSIPATRAETQTTPQQDATTEAQKTRGRLHPRRPGRRARAIPIPSVSRALSRSTPRAARASASSTTKRPLPAAEGGGANVRRRAAARAYAAILAALEAQCTKATFFPVGKVAGGYPEILRDVAKAGHTIGAHTVNHKTSRRRSPTRPRTRSNAHSRSCTVPSADRQPRFSASRSCGTRRNC